MQMTARNTSELQRFLSSTPVPQPQCPHSEVPLYVRQGATSHTHLPQEEEREEHLQRGRPDHVNVRGQVHEPLRVHRHEVDNLPDRGGLPGGIGDHQGLRDEAEGTGVSVAGSEPWREEAAARSSAPADLPAFPARPSHHKAPL